MIEERNRSFHGKSTLRVVLFVDSNRGAEAQIRCPSADRSVSCALLSTEHASERVYVHMLDSEDYFWTWRNMKYSRH